jgi:hypothetical protein
VRLPSRLTPFHWKVNTLGWCLMVFFAFGFGFVFVAVAVAM